MDDKTIDKLKANGVTDSEIAIIEKCDVFLDGLLDIIQESDDRCNDLNAAISYILSKLLPVAAISGGIKSNPDYDMQRKMVYMGNRAVVTAMKSMEASGVMERLKSLEALENMIRNIRN